MSMLPFQTNIPNVHMKNCYSWCMLQKLNGSWHYILCYVSYERNQRKAWLHQSGRCIYPCYQKSKKPYDWRPYLIKTNEKKILLSFFCARHRVGASDDDILDKIPCKGREFMYTLQNQHLVVIKSGTGMQNRNWQRVKFWKRFFSVYVQFSKLRNWLDLKLNIHILIVELNVSTLFKK